MCDCWDYKILVIILPYLVKFLVCYVFLEIVVLAMIFVLAVLLLCSSDVSFERRLRQTVHLPVANG